MGILASFSPRPLPEEQLTRMKIGKTTTQICKYRSHVLIGLAMLIIKCIGLLTGICSCVIRGGGVGHLDLRVTVTLEAHEEGGKENDFNLSETLTDDSEISMGSDNIMEESEFEEGNELIEDNSFESE